MSRKRPSNFKIPKRKKTTIQDKEDDEVPETITNQRRRNKGQE